MSIQEERGEKYNEKADVSDSNNCKAKDMPEL